MFFSVIIPLYNKAPYIEKALSSIVSQTFQDYELIVVDDGSKDDSASIAEKLIHSQWGDGSKAKLIRQANSGVSTARNNGVAASHGDYICFLDADDWWEPTFLEEMAKLIQDYPDAGIYGTGYTIINERKHKTRIAPIGVEPGFLKGYINYCQVYAKTLCMPLTSISVSLPRHIFDKMGGFKPQLKLGEDFDLWIRIALKYKVAFLNKPLSNYNQDVDTANRGVHYQKYDPKSFMTFYFDQFEKEEASNPSLKKLLDKIRVSSLLRFRVNNSHQSLVKKEISKVDFSNVDHIYRFYYYSPYPVFHIYWSFRHFLAIIKNSFNS